MGSAANLSQLFLMWSQPSVVTFYVDPKSNMATLASDWLTHFQLLLENFLCETEIQDGHP